MDIEEELALNYSEVEGDSTFRDSLEAELMLNYEDSSLRSIENTPRMEKSRPTPNKISTPSSTPILCESNTPSSSRTSRRPREFVVPSPPASTPRRVVLPHHRLKDPLEGIMFGSTSSVSCISSVSSVSSRSSFFEPSSSRISISSSLEDEDERGEDVHEEEEDVDRGPPSNAFFFERANCRHRGDLDVLLGSKCLRLASATLFDVIMPRTSEIFKSRNTISSTGSWQWVRNFLDGAIDLEVGANVLCSEGAIDTEETETNRVGFRT